MRNSFFRFIIVILISQGIVNDADACGGYWDPTWGQYTSIFNDRLIQDSTLLLFTRGGAESYESSNTQSHQNIDLWMSFIGQSIKYDDVYDFVYKFSFSDLKKIYNHIEKKAVLSVSPEIQKNAMTQWYIQDKDLESLGYLMYAKECEYFLDTSIIQYAWERKQIDINRKNRLIKNGKQLHNVCKSPFIKERFVYQIIRLSSYLDYDNDAIKDYQTLYSPSSISTSMISGWIEGLAGRSYYHLKQNNKAGYQWVKMYVMAPEKFQEAAQSFQFAELKYNDISSMCRSDKELRALAFLCGMNQNVWEIKSFGELALMDVNDPILEALAVHTFQQLEDDTNMNQMKDLVTALANLSSQPKLVRTDFWEALLCAAAIKAGDQARARGILDQWKSAVSDNVNIVYQRQVLRLVYDAIYKSTKEMEQSAFAILPLLTKQSDEGEGWSEYLSYTYMYDHYRMENDSMMMFGTLLNSVSRNTTTWDNQIEKHTYRAPITSYNTIYWEYAGNYITLLSETKQKELYVFLKLSSTNPFRKYYMGMVDEDIILDYMATVSIQKLKWAEANEIMRRMKPSDNPQTPSGKKLVVKPFGSFYNIKDYRMNTYNGDMGTMTRFQASQAMELMKIKADHGDLNACYDYASALYNCSYYGYNWLISDYYWTHNSDALYYIEKDTADRLQYREYYELREAEKYAVKATQSPKLKNDALFLAAMCVQNRDIKYEYEENYYQNYYQTSLSNIYFSQIDPNDNSIRNYCSYFVDFVNKDK